MKQIITINIGDPGIKIGDAVLSLYLAEHHLRKQHSNPLTEFFPMNNDSVFHQVAEGRCQHRAIAVDCDIEAVNELQVGQRRGFYNPRYCMGSKSSSGGTFSDGYYVFDKQMMTGFQENFQKMSESCDNLQGIIFNVSTLGGGSGILDRLSQKLSGQNYIKKVPKVAFAQYPSKDYSSSVVQKYNYVLSSHCLLEHCDLVVPFDNQTLYNYAASQMDIDRPGFKEINDIVAQVQSSVTLSMRSVGTLNAKLNDLCTNLICYPRIHYTYPSLVNPSGALSRVRTNEAVTREVMKPTSQLYNMMKVENKIAVGLFYRGATTHYQTMASLGKIRAEQPSYCVFEEWSPMGFKVAINQYPLELNSYRNIGGQSLSSLSCCSLTSSMEFGFPLAHNNHKFDLMYAKRAFVWHYVKRQLEQGQFCQAREDLAALEKDYERWGGCECCEQEEEGQVEQY